MIRNILMNSLLAASVLAPASGQALPAAKAAPASLALSGGRAPSFSLPDTNFNRYDILDYRGKWLLIDFISTACPHCKELTPKLEALKTKLGARVAILSIVVPPENQVTVAKYVSETKTTIPILFDSGQVAASYFKATPQRSEFDTPHLFAINPQGTIVRDWDQGLVNFPNVMPDLEKMIGAGGAKAAAKGK